jgi:hypothetical protein
VRDTLTTETQRHRGGKGVCPLCVSVSLWLTTLVGLVACGNSDFRFERIDGDHSVTLPLKLDGFYGLRDGASVKAEAHFVDGNDVVTMNIALYLRPPAEFVSGTYQATIAGKVTSGNVECPSLAFQGGQTALPAVGGVFILKDQNNRPLYRVRIPATMLTRYNPRP